MLIDCVTSPPADAMRAAGVTGVSRYLSHTADTSTLFKVIGQAEYDQLRSAGFDILLNWEYAAKDWLGGATAGAAHAAEAVRQAKALGHPAGAAIPGSADFDMTHDQWNAVCWQYAKAYSDGIKAGGYRAGVYGPWDVLEWCHYEGWFDMFWQSMSTSFSQGRNANQWPGAHLRQRRSGFVAGVDVDFNDILQANYGQYAVDAANTGGDVAGEYSPDTARAIAIGATQFGYVQYTDPAWDDDLKTYNLKAIEERLTAAIKAQAMPAPATVDPATLKAVLLDPDVLAAIAKAVNDDESKRLAS